MGSTHFGHLQEVQRRQEEACETQDLERRLAEIYSRIEGGDDASDLTAPQGALQRRRCASGRCSRGPCLFGFLTGRRPPASPAARRLILSGSVKRPAELTGFTQPLLGFGGGTPAVDVNSLALVAFTGQVASQRTAEYNGVIEHQAAQPEPKDAVVAPTSGPVTFRTSPTDR